MKKIITTIAVSISFISISQAEPTNDKALSVIERTTEENREKSLPPAPEKSGFGLSFEFGVPHPLKFSLEYMNPNNEWSGALSFGSFNIDITQADLKMSYSEVLFRWHPRKDALFIGGGIGQHMFESKKSDTYAAQPVSLKAEVSSTYLKPVAGWLWKKPNQRLFWGLELGIMIPVGDDYKFETSQDLSGTAEYDDAVRELEDISDLLGSTTLISIGMVRVGWEF